MKKNIRIVGLSVVLVLMGAGTRFARGAAQGVDLGQYEQRTKSKMSKQEKIDIWSEIVRRYGFIATTIAKQHSLYVNSGDGADAVRLLGRRDGVDVSLDCSPQDIFTREKKLLAKKYKIHLMPLEDTIDQVLISLCELLKNNEQLRSVIHSFKICLSCNTWRELQDSNRINAYYASNPGGKFSDMGAANVFVNPRMVIYSASGKENAQLALNIIYEHFKDVEGLNITPRYNAKVTSFIYVAQGDATDKGVPLVKTSFETMERESAFFERPYKVYYNPAVIPPQEGFKDHYLIHPKTGEKIMPTPDMYGGL